MNIDGGEQRKKGVVLAVCFAMISLFIFAGCAGVDDGSKSVYPCLFSMKQTTSDPMFNPIERGEVINYPEVCPSVEGRVDGYTYTFYSEYDDSYWSSDAFLKFDVPFSGLSALSWFQDKTGKMVTDLDSDGNLVFEGQILIEDLYGENNYLLPELEFYKEWNDKVLAK